MTVTQPTKAQSPITSFQRRYIVPLLAMLVLIVFVFVWFILRQQAQLLDAELQKKGKTIVQDFAEASKVSILLEDEESLMNTVKGIVEEEDEDVFDAAIFDPEGKLLFAYDTIYPLPPSVRSLEKYTELNLEENWLFITPVLNKTGNFIGSASIRLSRDRVLEMIKEASTKLILMALILSLTIVLVVYWLLMKIKSLAEQEIQRAREIEIAYEKLKELQEILKRANESLEERVKERTRELEKANRELQNVNKELKDFAYIVSHDLKAPLRAIASLTDWIIEDYNSQLDEDGQDQLHLLKSRVSRMYQLLEGILRYSRIGQGEDNKEIIDTYELVGDVITSLLPPENFEILIETSLPPVYGDRTKIIQVFQNLISNAIKYNDKPFGSVKIAAKEQAEKGLNFFYVKDNGKGIPQEDYDRVFRIFQTLEKDKESTESTGVGLTLVQKIIRKYGGDITLESVVGEGTTFIFWLPVVQPDGEVENEDFKLNLNLPETA